MLYNALRAPEIVVEGVAYREAVGRSLVRTAFFARERGRDIVRIKLLIPCTVAALEHQKLRAFVACMGIEPTSGVLM